jgi:dTDP-4-dehydrorhamnose reductase
VFDGSATSLHDEATPLNWTAYGRNWAEGERLMLAANPSDGTYIVRTAWL